MSTGLERESFRKGGTSTGGTGEMWSERQEGGMIKKGLEFNWAGEQREKASSLCHSFWGLNLPG